MEKPRAPAIKKAAKSDEPPVAPEEAGDKEEPTQGEVCVYACLKCFL